MKRFCLFLALCGLCCSLGARELVVTLTDGQRYAYHLSSKDKAVMLLCDEGFELGGDRYQVADVVELRIYAECPDDAIPTGVEGVGGQRRAAGGQEIFYDLQGRRLKQTSNLPRGIYVTNDGRKVWAGHQVMENLSNPVPEFAEGQNPCATRGMALSSIDTIWSKSNDRFAEGKTFDTREVDSIVFVNSQMRLYTGGTMRAHMYSTALGLTTGAACSDALVFADPGRIIWKPTSSDYDYNNDYTKDTNRWNFAHSRESEHFIVFWDRDFGDNPNSTSLPSAMRVNVDDLLQKAEQFYRTNIVRLGMATVGEGVSRLDKYKMSIYLIYQSEWKAEGAGNDNMIGTLWVNPSTCQPVGSTIAHEVGHCFQYQVACDWRAQGKSDYMRRGWRYGFGSNASGGNAFWEQCAQWQAHQDYPSECFNYQLSDWMSNYHRHLCHEWMRYASYWWQYQLVERHGYEAYGRLWRESVSPEDPLETYIRLFCGGSLDSLWADYYDYACRLVNYQFADIHPYVSASAKDYKVALNKSDDGAWQVAYASCPETAGVNIIRLNLPAAGTEVSADFVGLDPGTALLTADPALALKYEDDKSVSYAVTRYNTAGKVADKGWRYGFVAVVDDQIQRSPMMSAAEGKATYTVPTGATSLAFVVIGAPKTYGRHAWDDNDNNDQQWPYKVRFGGTNPQGKYDFDPDEAPCDTTVTYTVTAKGSSSAYELGTISLEGTGLMEAVAKALKLQGTDFTSRVMSIAAGTTAKPTEDKVVFALKHPTTGKYIYTYTATSGFWCSAAGASQAYGSAPVYVEYTASTNTLAWGHMPSTGAGKTYTLRPTFVYVKDGKEYHATIQLTIKLT